MNQKWLQILKCSLDNYLKRLVNYLQTLVIFTVTIPEKLTEIKDSITGFFNDWIVTPIKNLWNDIGNFFTVTIPEKYNEIVGKITTFFSNIVSGIGGFFTDAKTFVTDTIPTKIGEVTDAVTKFNEIKDSIIDFTPFRKNKRVNKTY